MCHYPYSHCHSATSLPKNADTLMLRGISSLSCLPCRGWPKNDSAGMKAISEWPQQWPIFSKCHCAQIQVWNGDEGYILEFVRSLLYAQSRSNFGMNARYLEVLNELKCSAVSGTIIWPGIQNKSFPFI